MWFWLVLVCAECFCEGGDDKRIPLLRDVFDAFPNTPVNIDIKVNNDTLIKKVCVCVSISVSVILCVGSSGIKHNISSFFLVANFYQIFCTSSKAALVLTIVNLKLCIWSVRQALKWGSIININSILKNWGGLILLKCSFYLSISRTACSLVVVIC